MHDFFEEKEKNNNKIIILISILLFLLLFTLSIVLYKKLASPKIFSVLLDQNQQSLVVGETIELSVKPSISKQLSSIDFYIDNVKISSCESVSKCKISYIAKPGDIGAHTASFVFTDKSGNTFTKSTSYTIKTDAPEISSINTNEKSSLNSGDYFYASVTATSTSPISSIDLYIDGSIAKQCTSSPCTALIGPFQKEDQGPHIYTYVVTNETGKSTNPGGTFEVKPEPSTPTKNDAPEISSINISNSDNTSDQPITLSVVTTDDDKVTSIIITIDDKEAIIICDNTSNCEATIKPKSGVHTYEITVIDNKGKQTKATGEIIIKEPVQKEKKSETKTTSQDTPTKNVISTPEIIYITSSGDTISVDQSLIVSVVAKDAKAITSIIGYIDAIPKKTCANISTCSFTFGPVTKQQVGSHTYSFTVTNSDKQSITKTFPFTVKIATPAIIPSDSPIQLFDTQINNTDSVTPDAFVPVDKTLFNTNDLVNITKSETTKSPLWIDTDGGIKEAMAGKCQSNVPNARYQKYLADTCLDSKTLKEYYLDASASSCLSKDITCAGSCYQGACVRTAPSTKVTQPWTDSDGGIKEAMAGTCQSNVPGALYQKAVSDVCIDSTILKEYYLDASASSCLSTEITCDDSCNNGACVRTAPQYSPNTETSPEAHPAPQYTPVTETSPEPHAAPQYTPDTETSPEIHEAPQYTPTTETSPEPRPAPQYTPTPTWTDSDGGYVISTFGTCSISDGSIRPKSDFCIDDKTLQEVYITRGGESCIEETVTCEGSCDQGHCIPPTR